MTRKIGTPGLARDIAKQAESSARIRELMEQLRVEKNNFEKRHARFVDNIRNKGATTGNPLTDALLVAGGENSSHVEDVLDNINKQFSGRVGEPALFVLHTQEGDKDHCVLLLGVLKGSVLVVDGRDGFCSPPFNLEVSTVDSSASDIRLVKGSSNLFREFSDIRDITAKNLKCHVGINQIIYWFRKYGGGTKGLITLYLMAKEAGIDLPEIEELHPTLVDTLDTFLDLDVPREGLISGGRISFFVGGVQQYVDLR
ncbi:hypothetical protein AUJ77_01965 [Candidatus Nomurabacteria bacterium CG1_02_43_90]|uniref:Uncharacterized protein n=1 Tax=Candidatus Nomurabacteria bacterium CG1_02_43_90 TaxID=1805281 RepID=A0A1J4V089_9BACT|nr:MAG: hypothetical protein AUJ77_01965 [Candidatus Nomurabacteria bacterium CG1_02_43_90]